MLRERFGFIGAGRMATALARGLLEANLTTSQRIAASDPSEAARSSFTLATHAVAHEHGDAVVEQADVLFLAVKPQQIASVLGELRGRVGEKHLVISIAAGVPIGRLAGGLGPGPRLVRVMPNTPCLVGRGASAYSLGPGATQDDDVLVHRLLEAVGVAHRLDESMLDAVTGLSGSGPAFVYRVIEALAEGGARAGLPPQTAADLAMHTVLGAAEMVRITRQPPGDLVDQVTSPGGTTVAGLEVLEREGLAATLIGAVEAAARRSSELGRQDT